MLSALGIATGTLIIFMMMLSLLFVGMPLGFMTGFIALSMSYFWFGNIAMMQMVANRVSDFTTSYTFIAVPMFVLMATLLDKTGIARDLYNAMRVMAGRIRGGVAVQSMVVAVILASMSGIIGGETVLLGMLALPQMLRLGYNQKLAIGVVVGGGALGTMVPPSIVLIIYGMTSNVSIGDLFLAAVPAAAILSSMYILYILIICRIYPDYGPAMDKSEMEEMTREDMKKMFLDILMPILIAVWILGSIYAGIASVTEAACVGVVGVGLAAAIRGELNVKVIFDALKHTISTVGMIIWVGIGATMIIGVYNLMGGDIFINDLFMGLDMPPIFTILIMMFILLILGMFLDWIGVAMLTMPIFVPIITNLGYDPIWFGVLFCVNMQVSFLSPPFGPAAFYLKSVAPEGIELTDIFKSVWPFIIMQVITLAILITFPEVVEFIYK
ncbi:TRAP transporter large permease subunit [Desulforhopalus sp. IMCC35007]|uniref:TRAP transporter large permease n=1 Tax=Desulforhopalus sp. IMCC35007 TaxID=2569543 RepID=UPI0010AE670E|nr:TRAP transporter large permease subunit [Desulforhopalus sp. IMCC35007]TKB06829.1 TRAP transporter large permease subunit [Desulforhopalus sp. IMCC35007]